MSSAVGIALGPEEDEKLVARHATENIAVSQSVARAIGIRCKVIPNPFEKSVFHSVEEQPKTQDLVFLGRLVTSKGVKILIRSLKQLKNRGLKPHLTLIGEGPERSALEQLVRSLQLENQVCFTGAITTEKVAQLLHAHKIMVVPSIWNEGFGVVALEGIESGCVVLGSDSGGLPAGDPRHQRDAGIAHFQSFLGRIQQGLAIAHERYHAPPAFVGLAQVVIGRAFSTGASRGLHGRLLAA